MKPVYLAAFLACLSAQAFAQCDPEFTFTIETRLDTATVVFKAVDATPGLLHTWNFADGTPDGSGATVTHHYTIPGPYGVKHTIKSASGDCIDSTTYYYVWPEFPVSCDAEFTLTKHPGYDDGMYIFKPLTFGGTSTTYELTINGQVIGVHDGGNVYLSEGNHEICLNVKYFDCTANSCQQFFVPPFCNWTASFSANPSPSNPKEMHFAPNITAGSMRYSWSFGDGSTSTNQTPIHEYAQPGQYDVQLIISDGGYCADTVQMATYVAQLPGNLCNASFTYTVDASNHRRFTFTALSDEKIYFQRWKFVSSASTQEISTEDQSITYDFPTDGTYYVLLDLTTINSCTDHYWAEIKVSLSSGDSSNAIVMPNPVYGSQIQLQMSFDQAEPVKLTVYNSSGNIVYTGQKVTVKGVNQFIVPVDKLQRGVYYMHVQGTSSRKKSTFVKM